MHIFAALNMVLQDGGTHKALRGCKGDAGAQARFSCRNLYAEKSDLAVEDGTDFLNCSLIHGADLDFATDQNIFGSLARSAAMRGIEPAANSKLWEPAVGFSSRGYSRPICRNSATTGCTQSWYRVL